MFKFLALVAISAVEGISIDSMKQTSVETEKYLIPGGWKVDNLVHHPNGHVCTGCDFCPGVHFPDILEPVAASATGQDFNNNAHLVGP